MLPPQPTVASGLLDHEGYDEQDGHDRQQKCGHQHKAPELFIGIAAHGASPLLAKDHAPHDGQWRPRAAPARAISQILGFQRPRTRSEFGLFGYPQIRGDGARGKRSGAAFRDRRACSTTTARARARSPASFTAQSQPCGDNAAPPAQKFIDTPVRTRTSGSAWIPLRSLMMGIPTDTKLDQLSLEKRKPGAR
jgi:hypothetical protein